ncbi:MAG: hypothetical protein JWO69_1191 [Thermoleophilia bacterium]|nr:hypothetical protein [Thermoleophilia bacterium]
MLIGRIPIIAASIAGATGLTAGVLHGKAPGMPKGWEPVPGERLAAGGVFMVGGFGSVITSTHGPLPANPKAFRHWSTIGALGVLTGTFLLGQAIGSAFKAPSHKS